MQFARAEKVEQIPSPPALEQALFVSPWMPAVVIAAIGIIATIALSKMEPRRAFVPWLAAIGVAIGGAMVLIASLVRIEREELIDRTRELIDSAAAGRHEPVEAILASDARLTGLYRSGSLDRASLLRLVRDDMNGRFALREWSIGTLNSLIDSPTVARTQVRVNATAREFPFPASGWWIIHWRKESNGRWMVTTIETQQLDALPKGGM